MAIVLNITGTHPMPGGQRLLAGFATIGTYFTHANPQMNFANFGLDVTAIPVVVFGTEKGYTFNHSQGNAGAGTVAAFFSSSKNGSVSALDQVANNTNLSAVKVSFTAICDAS